jgi:hypothetical protein
MDGVGPEGEASEEVRVHDLDPDEAEVYQEVVEGYPRYRVTEGF